MNNIPDFENESEVKLRWFIEHFPSPHPFFAPAMAALEKREKERKQHPQGQVTIHNSNIANLNFGSQVGQIAAHAIGPTAADFHEFLRQMFRVADLEWSQLMRGKYATDRAICKQVDELRAGLAILYGKCPSDVDAQPLVDAIQKLDETKEYRVGNMIGSRLDGDKVCRLMEAALRSMKIMLPEERENA